MDKTVELPISRPKIPHFRSKAVEQVIATARNKIADPHYYRLFAQCFPNTLDTTVAYQLQDKQPDTYVITGDINAMWLRDSTAQVWSYLPLMQSDLELKMLIQGVINRQTHYLLLDPYANAFNFSNEGSIWDSDHTHMRKELHERKWELDSVCYPLRLAHAYWQYTKDTTVFNQTWLKMAKLIVHTMKSQQHKKTNVDYTFQRTTAVATDTLADNGLGNPVNPVGLIASAFRPSDDATIFPFLIPSNFMAVRVLMDLAKLVNAVYQEAAFAKTCLTLAVEVEKAIHQYAIVHHPKHGEILAYEVDGFGSVLLMDDANVPSLLSLPYLDAIRQTDTFYQHTRQFVLSKDNPWYFQSKLINGIGSIHTGRGRVWPIAIAMRGLTSDSRAAQKQCIDLLASTHANTYFMHESINIDNPNDYTRPWFAWANTLCAELFIHYYGLFSELS